MAQEDGFQAMLAAPPAPHCAPGPLPFVEHLSATETALGLDSAETGEETLSWPEPAVASRTAAPGVADGDTSAPTRAVFSSRDTCPSVHPSWRPGRHGWLG